MEDENRAPEAEARAVADIVARHIRPVDLVALRGNHDTAPVIAIPEGFRLESLKPFVDAYLPGPERRRGTARFADLDSFVDHANRFKDGDSAIFAQAGPDDASQPPSLTAVLDYHRAGEPPADRAADVAKAGAARWGSHRGVYAPPFSKEWKQWAAADGAKMLQTDFAEFLEDRGVDLIDPPNFQAKDLSDADKALRDLTARLNLTFGGTAAIMELSRGLRVFAEEKVANVTNLSTGEGEIRFEVEHKDQAGKPLKVPGLFLIAIPVFERGPLYRVPVRLRYRAAGGSVIWRVIRHRPEAVFDHAFDEIVAAARERTGLPVFGGTAETTAGNPD